MAQVGYYEVPHTPGLWNHFCRHSNFTLIVDYFGIKYEGLDNAQHLINALKKHDGVDLDWSGSICCGIRLDWNYGEGHVDISMPTYVSKQL